MLNRQEGVEAKLTPLALKDAPALIESVFPAQKVSFEAQEERRAVQSQTLTGLGSYWKGRKPLILVRAIVLGCLLPQTDDAEADLEIFEKLMAFDNESLARRALDNNALKPKEIAARIHLHSPFLYFKAKIENPGLSGGELAHWSFPLDCDERGNQASAGSVPSLRRTGSPSTAKRWRPSAPIRRWSRFASGRKRWIRNGYMSLLGLRLTATTLIWESTCTLSMS